MYSSGKATAMLRVLPSRSPGSGQRPAYRVLYIVHERENRAPSSFITVSGGSTQHPGQTARTGRRRPVNLPRVLRRIRGISRMPFSSRLVPLVTNLPSRVTAQLALPDGQLLVGLADGRLLLFDVHRSGCPVIAHAPPPQMPAAVEQLAADRQGAGFIFVLRGGSVQHIECPLVHLHDADDPTKSCPELRLSAPAALGRRSSGLSCDD